MTRFARVLFVFVVLAVGATQAQAQVKGAVGSVVKPAPKAAPQLRVKSATPEGHQSLVVGQKLAANVVGGGGSVPSIILGQVQMRLQYCEAPTFVDVGSFGQLACWWLVNNATSGQVDLDVTSHGFGLGGDFDVAPKELLTLAPGTNTSFYRGLMFPGEEGCVNLSFYISLRGQPLGSVRLLDYQGVCMEFGSGSAATTNKR